MLPATLLCLCLTALGSPLVAVQRERQETRTPRITGRLLVSGFNSDALHSYVAWSGAPRSASAPVPGAQSIVRGPDGLLYVCAEEVDRVLRIDPETLTLLDAFVFDDAGTPGDETGGLDGPTAAVFGPDGDLFVSSFETDQILRYDGGSGAFLGVFVAAGLGGLDGPDAGTKFGPDGNLYVPSFWNDRVLRYDGVSGASMGDFIPFRSGSLRRPRDLVYHERHWYVASSANGRILRYDEDGTFTDLFASPPTPYSLAFHPQDGELYVVSLQGDNVRVYDGETGAFLHKIVPNGSGGLSGATYLYFLP